VLGFAQKAGNTGGLHTLLVLVAGEGRDEDLGTSRRAAAVTESSPRERERARGGELEKKRQG